MVQWIIYSPEKTVIYLGNETFWVFTYPQENMITRTQGDQSTHLDYRNLFSFAHMCVCVYSVHACMHLCLHVCVCRPACFYCGCLHRWLSILLRQGLLWNAEADNAGWSSFPENTSQVAGLQVDTWSPWFFVWSWGMKLGNCSSSRGKGFSRWALSPAPALITVLKELALTA